ncbi:MAG: MFS transporter, partial [Thermoproteus sp.]
MARPGRVLALTSIAHFINDGNMWLLPVAYAYMAQVHNMPPYIAGVIALAFSGLGGLASPLVGALMDRYGRPLRLIGLGMALWAAGLAVFGYGVEYYDIPIALAGAVISGVASAFYHPLGSAALALLYGGSSGYAMGVNGAMGSLGRALYPAISTALFTLFGSKYLYALLALAFVTVIAAAPMFLGGDVEVAKRRRGGDSSERPNMKAVSLLTAVVFIRGFALQGISQYVGVILVRYFSYSFGQDLGNELTFFLLPAIVGQPLFGYLSDTVGRRTTLAVSTAGAALSILALIATKNLYWLPLFGFFTFSAFPLTLSLAGDLVPRSSMGLATSLVWGLGNTGGGALGPLAMGLLLTSMGLGGIYIMASLAAISAALTAAIPRPPKRSKTPLF